MEGRVDFDINDSLKQYLSDPSSVQTPEADSALFDCESDPESLTPQLINSILNPIVDAVAENPEAIARSSYFDSLQVLLKCAPTSTPETFETPNPDSDLFTFCRSTSLIPPPVLSKILDTVVSGFSTQADVVVSELETEETDTIQHHKQLLEIYGFLLQWSVAAIETKAAEKSASTSASAIRGRGGKGGKSKPAKDAWDPSSQIQAALDVMSKVLKLKLARLFPTSSERDTFVSLSTRAVYLILENESRIKSMAIRMHSFKVLCIAVKHHGHAYGSPNKTLLPLLLLLLTFYRSTNFDHSKSIVFRAFIRADGRISTYSCGAIRLSTAC